MSLRAFFVIFLSFSFYFKAAQISVESVPKYVCGQDKCWIRGYTAPFPAEIEHLIKRLLLLQVGSLHRKPVNHKALHALFSGKPGNGKSTAPGAIAQVVGWKYFEKAGPTFGTKIKNSYVENFLQWVSQAKEHYRRTGQGVVLFMDVIGNLLSVDSKKNSEPLHGLRAKEFIRTNNSKGLGIVGDKNEKERFVNVICDELSLIQREGLPIAIFFAANNVDTLPTNFKNRMNEGFNIVFNHPEKKDRMIFIPKMLYKKHFNTHVMAWDFDSLEKQFNMLGSFYKKQFTRDKKEIVAYLRKIEAHVDQGLGGLDKEHVVKLVRYLNALEVKNAALKQKITEVVKKGKNSTKLQWYLYLKTFVGENKKQKNRVLLRQSLEEVDAYIAYCRRYIENYRLHIFDQYISYIVEETEGLPLRSISGILTRILELPEVEYNFFKKIEKLILDAKKAYAEEMVFENKKKIEEEIAAKNSGYQHLEYVQKWGTQEEVEKAQKNLGLAIDSMKFQHEIKMKSYRNESTELTNRVQKREKA